MKSPLSVGAVRAPKTKLLTSADGPETGKARRIAKLSAAAAIVVGVGAASALFVNYLADRALARTADAPVTVKPMVAKAVAAPAVKSPAETKIAALAPAPAPAPSQPVAPPKAEIAVATPDPAAVAKVAVGPEHAIELPTDDPTASPIIRADEISASEDEASVDESVPNVEPIAAYADDDADGTQTAAIDPAEAVLDEQPVKPKRQKAAQAKPQPVEKQTEVASLPGVDVGGIAGRPSGGDNAGSTVRTVTKPAAKAAPNLGGVPAGAARVTDAVKLRSGPNKSSGVLGVVPSGSAVNVLSCNGWCQVAYNGRTGWVYKNYLATAATTSQAKPQQKQPAANSASAANQPGATAPRKAISSRL